MWPLGALAIVGALTSLADYARRRRRTVQRNVQFAGALFSWALLWFATASPFAVKGMSSLPVHMVGHILVMFLVPMGLVASGSARSWWWVVPVGARRRLLRWWYVDRRWHVPHWLASPYAATIALNAVMVTFHSPRVFDTVMTHPWSMDWIGDTSFFLSGLWFFHYILTSAPRSNRYRGRDQLAMLIITGAEMLLLAMSMAILTDHSWYDVYTSRQAMAGMSGMTAPLSAAAAFSQQRLAAGILWICGDVWAVPCVVVVIRRVVQRDGSLLGALNRHSERWSGVPG